MVQNVFTFAKTAALLGLIGLGFLVRPQPRSRGRNFTDFWRNAGWNFDTRPPGRRGHGGLAVLRRRLEQRHLHRRARCAIRAAICRSRWRWAWRIVSRALHRLQFRLPERAAARRRSSTRRRIAWPPRRPRACSGPSAVQVMAAAIMISTFGCANGLILSGARVYYAMALDGLFFRTRRRTSTRATTRRSSRSCVQCVWAVPAHAKRQLQRPARLCYLCCAAFLHPDDRRHLRAAPHPARYGPALSRVWLSGAAGAVHRRRPG